MRDGFYGLFSMLLFVLDENDIPRELAGSRGE